MGQCYRIAKNTVGGADAQTSAASATAAEAGGSAAPPSVPPADAARREIRPFSYRQLKKATKNFRAESVIVEGQYGCVYKGYLKKTRQIIAVRKLNPDAVRKFDAEVRMLSVLSHPNLIELMGTCNKKEHRYLVYEFMPLESLKSHLIDATKAAELDWNKRMKIAAGVAAAMNYLHNEANPPVIFRDLKSTNILLDEAFNPKLSDFGDAKLVTDDDAISSQPMPMNNRTGYAAPEYVKAGVNTIKSDVYNFGVLMMELLTGNGPVCMTLGNRRHMLIEMWNMALASDIPGAVLAKPDLRLNRNFPEDSVRRALEVTLMCMADDPQSRPNMDFMVEEFNRLASPSDASASTSAAVDASASASASASAAVDASASAAVGDNPVDKGGDDDSSSSDDGITEEGQARRARRLEKQPIRN